MSIRGLVFDFDGLILDTELPEYQAWQAIYQQHKAVLPMEEWVKCLGASYDAFNPVLYLQEQLSEPIDNESVLSAHHSHADEIMASLPVLPGVRELLQAAKSQGLKIGLASSSSREWVTSKLTRVGLIDYFECIFTSNDVEQVKPAPDLYAKAVACLGLEPGSALALEDSPNGVTAAKAAGLYCVAVPTELFRNLPLEHADLVLPSLAAMPLPALLAHFEKNGAS